MRSDLLLLLDILDSITEIETNTSPVEADFNANKFLQSHILRHIQIIGEASWRLSKTDITDARPEIPWKKIAGMRHVLVHEYFEVNWTRVYPTARDHAHPSNLRSRQF